MRNLAALVLPLLVSTVAAAQENTSGTFGVGAEGVLLQPFTVGAAGALAALAPGAAIAAGWDSGQWHADGLLYLLFVENSVTSFALGGRFIYELHSSERADFGVGGGLTFGFTDPAVRFELDGLFQIRIFLADNVALNAQGGLGFSLGDGSFVVGLTSEVVGSVGLMYYFN